MYERSTTCPFFSFLLMAIQRLSPFGLADRGVTPYRNLIQSLRSRSNRRGKHHSSTMTRRNPIRSLRSRSKRGGKHHSRIPTKSLRSRLKRRGKHHSSTMTCRNPIQSLRSRSKRRGKHHSSKMMRRNASEAG